MKQSPILLFPGDLTRAHKAILRKKRHDASKIERKHEDEPKCTKTAVRQTSHLSYCKTGLAKKLRNVSSKDDFTTAAMTELSGLFKNFVF